MGWWIFLGIVALLAVLPLGASVRYDARGAVVILLLGPLKITLVPRPKKKKKETPPKKEETPPAEPPRPAPPQPRNPAPPPAPKPEKPKEKKGGSVLDFFPLVEELFRFLGNFRRKLRVPVLEVKLILGGDDPCDLAVNYGRAWAAVGNLLPKLDKWFVIQKRDIEVECDFTSSQTLVIARLDITITLGRLVAAVVTFGVRALIQFLNIQKKRKGGAVT